MEGVLWKWTNYWNGWQTRWFVLENGILSYYKSQEEVSQGCKGSVKVSVCQINVSAIDNTRMDLVIPGQQHMYLRAPSPPDRQKWLVALGSAKACLQDASDGKIPGLAAGDSDSLSHRRWELTLYCDLMMQQVHAVKTLASQPDVEKLSEASSLLSSTCDTFIRTLEDIMKLTHSSTIPDMPIPNIPQVSKTPKPSLGTSTSQENR